MSIRPRERARNRPALRRGTREHHDPPADPVAAVRPEERVRQAGGPEDHALYACHCGTTFTAVVSASVSCPHCGAPQAW